MRTPLVSLLLALLTCSSVAVRAQSLADVAAAEARRRKAQTGQAKVYTNDDLSGTMQDTATSSAPAPSNPAGDSAAAKPASGTAKPAEGKTEAVDEKKTEAYWRARVTAIQQSLARNRLLVEAMQSRINALTAEALSTDDPGRDAALTASLATANGEMARLKQESEKQNSELLSLQEEARRAGIPPGWLR